MQSSCGRVVHRPGHGDLALGDWLVMGDLPAGVKIAILARLGMAAATFNLTSRAREIAASRDARAVAE
jgi:hypothetical protein